MSAKEKKPSLLERSSRVVKDAMAVGFLALAGVSIMAPTFGGAAIEAGLVWAGADAVHTSAKKRRLRRTNE